MNRQKSNLLLIFIFYIVCQVSIFVFHITRLVFWIFQIILDITEGWEQPKRQIPVFNVMTIHARRQINVRKQTMLLDRADVGPPKQRTCWSGLNRSVHEPMIKISNVKVHLKTRSGNVNIRKQNNHNFIRKKICSSGPAYFFLLFFLLFSQVSRDATIVQKAYCISLRYGKPVLRYTWYLYFCLLLPLVQYYNVMQGS